MAENKTLKIQRVLFINPFLYHSKNINIGIDPVVVRHAGQAIKTGVTFPIGLAYMAAMLLESGYEVKLLDPLAECLPLDEIYDASCWSDAIVMPYSPGHKEGIKRYFSDFRQKVRIVSGGIAPYIHDYLLSNDIADIIIKGEPEETIVELVRQYPNVSDVKGIIFRSNSNKPVINPRRPLIMDLDRLPFPVRHLTNPIHYWDISFFGQPTAWILLSRGCSFDCIFCAQFEINQRAVRRRNPKNIVDEMEQVVKKQKVKNFVFFDETFNLSDKFVIDVCDEIIKRNLKVHWWCSARPDLVRFDVVKRMKESGCIEMRFGVESANDEILRYLNKDTTVEKMKMSYPILQEINPRLIYASVTMFGPNGPDSHRGGFDFQGQARSGLMFSTGEPDMPPLAVVFAVIDQVTAIWASHAVLSALIMRDRSGMGQQVQVSILGSALGLQYFNVLIGALTNDAPRHSRTDTDPMRNMYQCKGGKWICFTLPSLQPGLWKEFCQAIERPDLESDARFISFEKRLENCGELVSILDDIFAAKPREEWDDILERHGFFCAPVNESSELKDDLQVTENKYVVDFNHPVFGKVQFPGYPVHFSEASAGPRSAAPELGEHTEEVLREIGGYSAEEIERLRGKEII